MTFDSDWRDYSAPYELEREMRNARAQRLCGGAALGCVALACLWTLGVNLAGGAADPIDADQADIVGSRGDRLLAASASAPALANAYAVLFDPHAALGFLAGTFERSAASQIAERWALAAPPTRSADPKAPEIAAAPKPPGRIAQTVAALERHLPQIHTASLRDGAHANTAAANPPADKPTLFEKLFGKSSTVALAYAAPDDRGILSDGLTTAGRYDRSTAVYDISARTVYLPDGSRLEAHSGLGSLLDDPRHPEAKDRGVTPPTIYDLELREAPFHGVRALRLIPQDEDKVFGRSGLLAHSFMLGPNGDSNGCVSFRNYDAFLRAYTSGEIKRLAVVTSLD
jgi:hypothetical protein